MFNIISLPLNWHFSITLPDGKGTMKFQVNFFGLNGCIYDLSFLRLSRIEDASVNDNVAQCGPLQGTLFQDQARLHFRTGEGKLTKNSRLGQIDETPFVEISSALQQVRVLAHMLKNNNITWTRAELSVAFDPGETGIGGFQDDGTYLPCSSWSMDTNSYQEFFRRFCVTSLEDVRLVRTCDTLFYESWPATALNCFRLILGYEMPKDEKISAGRNGESGWLFVSTCNLDTLLNSIGNFARIVSDLPIVIADSDRKQAA